jgi:hypothetical protein
MLMQSVDNPTTQKIKGAVKLDNRKSKRNAVGAHPWLWNMSTGNEDTKRLEDQYKSFLILHS